MKKRIDRFVLLSLILVLFALTSKTVAETTNQPLDNDNSVSRLISASDANKITNETKDSICQGSNFIEI